MENPTFKLEGIIKSQDDYQDFEGPLALILLLLNKNKIEIHDIKISLILEQYLEYLDELQRMDLEIASEFVAMASHLLYIKAKSLLVAEEEISELETLISSLEELKNRDNYAKIKSVSEKLRDMWDRGTESITKFPEYFEPENEYKYSHDKSDLVSAMLLVLERSSLKSLTKSSKVIVPDREIYSVTDKAASILKRLKTSGITSVRSLLISCGSRSELVSAFLAILELCRTGDIRLVDGEGDILLELKA